MKNQKLFVSSFCALVILCGCDTVSLSRQGKEIEKQKAVQFDQAWTASQEVIKRYFTVKRTDYTTGQVTGITLPGMVTFPKTRQKVVADIVDTGDGWYEVEVRVMNQIEMSTANAFSNRQSHYDWKTIDFDESLEVKLVEEIYKEISGREGSKSSGEQAASGDQGKQTRRPGLSAGQSATVSEPGIVNSRPGARSHLAFVTRRPSIKDPMVKALLLGDIHFKEGNYEGAEEQYLIAQKQDMADPVVWLALGHARFAMGSFSDAAKALRLGLDGYKSWGTVNMDRRDFYANPDDFSRQLAALDEWVKAHPNDVDAHFLLGYNHYFSGRPTIARDSFKRVLELEPNDVHAKEFLRLLGSDQVI